MCPESEASGAPGTNTNGAVPTVHKPHHAERPYQSVRDFLSNTDKFQIIESTLREGEQFANAFFDTGTSYLCPATRPPIANPSTKQRPRLRCIVEPPVYHPV